MMTVMGTHDIIWNRVSDRIIMVISKCYFSREHIALSYKKWCGHRIRKKQQIKSTAHEGESNLK